MNTLAAQLQNHFLRPGELFITETPTQVSTVLGSCVALTLFHPRQRIGAICHALLPMGDRPQDFKFVNSALAYLLACFDRRGVPRRELVVKLFGGAEIFNADQSGGSALNVGRQNVTMATKELQREGLRLHASDVGGRQGRKILFFTHTGEVHLRRLAEAGQTLR